MLSIGFPYLRASLDGWCVCRRFAATVKSMTETHALNQTAVVRRGFCAMTTYSANSAFLSGAEAACRCEAQW